MDGGNQAMLEIAQVRKTAPTDKKKSAKGLTPAKSAPREITPEMKTAIDYAKKYFAEHKKEFIISANAERVASYVQENYKPEFKDRKKLISALEKSWLFRGKIVPKVASIEALGEAQVAPITEIKEKQAEIQQPAKRTETRELSKLSEIGAEKTAFRWFHYIPIIGWAMAALGIGKRELTDCEQLGGLDKNLVVYKPESKSFWRFLRSPEIDEKATIERIRAAVNQGKPIAYKDNLGKEHPLVIITENAGEKNEKERIMAQKK